MNKKIFITISSILLLVLVPLIISVKIKENDHTNDESQPVTKEFLMSEYDITEEEFESIDVNRVLRKLSWRTDGFDQNTTKEMVIEMLKKEQERIIRDEASSKHFAEVNLGYLFAADEYTGEYPDFSTLKYFAYTQEFETYSVSGLIDFDKSKFCDFTPESWVSSDYTQASKVVKLTQQHKEKIIQALRDGDLVKWKHYYEDKKFKGDIYWSIGLEFKDGLIISYNGTAGDDGFPDEYDDMMTTISSLFAGQPITTITEDK